jgi:nucleotide-binding universal stress UspA family protein
MSRVIGNVPRYTFAQSILHSMGFSPSSHVAFVHALAIALIDQSRLDILQSGSTARKARQSFPSVREALRAWGLLEPGSARSAVFEEFGVRIRKLDARGNPVRSSLEHMQEARSDLIVLGANHRRHGLAGWLQPSQVTALVRRSRAMSLVVPDGCRGFVSPQTGTLSLERILLPIDETTDATRSLICATALAGLLRGRPVEIELFHVGKRALPSLKRPEGDGWTWLETRIQGEVVDEILRAARKADLIVMPMKTRRGLRHVFRRSVTERVLRSAGCPVLAVPDY